MSDVLNDAYDSIPGLRDAERALAAVQTRLKALRSPASAPAADLSGEVVTAVMNGDDVPESLGRRAWEQQQATAFQQAELTVLRGVEGTLKNRHETALRNGVPGGLRTLRRHLDELLAEARPAAVRVARIPDAQAAIDAGPEATAAWQGFADLVSRYRAIRKAQTMLARAACGDAGSCLPGTNLVLDGVLRVWGEIENVTDVWPEWAPQHWDGKPIRAPWPLHNTNRPFDVTWDRQWLLWLLTTPGVRVWLPTLDELHTAYERQHDEAAKRARKNAKRRGEPGGKRPVHFAGPGGERWAEFH